jgi:hypothetical protein
MQRYLLQRAWGMASPWLPGSVRDAISELAVTCRSEPREGVTCTDATAARSFKVELKMKAGAVDHVELGNIGVRALAVASGEPDRVQVEWNSCSCTVGGKEFVLTVFVHLPTHRAVGAWIGNILYDAFFAHLDLRPLTCVEVTPVLQRGAIVHRQVAIVMQEWGSDKEAWRMVWRPAMGCVEKEMLPKYDIGEMWVSPIIVRGFSVVISDKEKKEKEKEPEDATALMPVGVAAEYRRRLAESAKMTAQEKSKEEGWIAAVKRLPFGKFSPPLCSTDGATEKAAAMAKAEASMDAVSRGMAGPKAVVMQIVGLLLSSPKSNMRALGLHGPPGCGKTTFAVNAISAALGRPAKLVNLGGAKDSSVLLGHDYTYSGSRPGMIFSAVATMGVCDPIIVFDELDKVSDTPKGHEIINALMCLVDPSQNATFAETYMSEAITLDLSRALFVFTFNVIEAVSPHVLFLHF